MREVSEATGLPSAYISLLRKGRVARPPADKVQALADFFGVDVRRLTGQGPALAPLSASAELDAALQHALENPIIQRMVLRADKFGDAEKLVLLRMIESVEEIAKGGPERRRAKKTRADEEKAPE